jgi:hypothetical protein
MTAPTDTTKRETDPMTDKARELARELLDELNRNRQAIVGGYDVEEGSVDIAERFLSAAREEASCGLRSFAQKVVRASQEGYDVYGGDIQEWAVEQGLLAPVKVVEPCGEDCACAEWDDFPQTCYRFTAALSPEGSTEGGE